MPTESAKQALAILRQGNQTFQWYVVPLLAFVFYVYTFGGRKTQLEPGSGRPGLLGHGLA
jgi:hypothetical protein